MSQGASEDATSAITDDDNEHSATMRVRMPIALWRLK